MRGKRWTLALVATGGLLGAAAGCQKYVAIPNSAADRIWIITADQSEVFRCWDLKNQTGKLMAICRRAEHVGKGEDTDWTQIAERTNPPPHPDSTEICSPMQAVPPAQGPPGRATPPQRRDAPIDDQMK